MADRHPGGRTCDQSSVGRSGMFMMLLLVKLGKLFHG